MLILKSLFLKSAILDEPIVVLTRESEQYKKIKWDQRHRQGFLVLKIFFTGIFPKIF